MPSQECDSRPMSECEETDFQGSCMVPGKRKRKKNSRKDPRDQVALKTDSGWKKKKRKNSKCKDPLGTKKQKKKDKKKKERNMSIAPDGKRIFTPFSQAEADPTTIGKTQSLCRHQDQKPKPSKKKKVAFDLTPGYIRPQYVLLTPRPKESAAFENKPLGDMAGLTQDNSEDVNSQDLFITQKMFRAPSPEPSSGESGAAAAAAQTLAQRRVIHEECELEGSARGLYGQQPPWVSQTTACVRERKARIKTTRCSSKNGENGSQVKVELPDNSFEYQFVNAQPQDEPTVVSASESWTSRQQISTSTQTENFFTVKLSSYLSFICQVSARSADLQPLDLSLPQRAREDPAAATTKSLLPGQKKANESRRSLKTKQVKAGCVAKTNPCRCSESSPKSADTTASSGEEQPGRTKLDLTQVRAVQTRLNESFFFKTKGDGQPPRPESPLMKLSQGRDRRNRK